MTMGMSGTSAGDGSERWLERLEELIGLQLELVRGIDSVGAAQSEAALLGDADAVSRVLDERQFAVERLREIDAELASLRARWDAAGSEVAPDRRGRVLAAAGQVSELLVRIAARDRADCGLLEEQRDAVARELGDVRRGRGALAAYGARGAAGPSYQDREG